MNADHLLVSSDCELVTVRVIGKRQEMVFEAWTNPVILQKWWGPAGFTNTIREFDLRPGGKWIFTMHGPEKGHYLNECEFVKIERPRLLVWNRLSEPLFRVVVLFEEIAREKTKVTFRMQFDSVDACKKIKGLAGDKNEENFDRLENELQKMA